MKMLRLILATLALVAGTAAATAPADAAPGSFRLKGVTVAPQAPGSLRLKSATVAPDSRTWASVIAPRGPFSGSKIRHHNPDNGYHPQIPIKCQGETETHYLGQGDASTDFCGDVGRVYVIGGAKYVRHDGTGWHTWIDNTKGKGYWRDAYNGWDVDLAVKAS